MKLKIFYGIIPNMSDKIEHIVHNPPLPIESLPPAQLAMLKNMIAGGGMQQAVVSSDGSFTIKSENPVPAPEDSNTPPATP